MVKNINKMKIVFIMLLVFLLSGCCKANKITNYKEFDKIVENKMNGKYDEAVCYDFRRKCIAGHIKGFLCTKEMGWDNETVYNNILKTYSKKAVIILICEDGVQSSDMANKLVKKGYSRVYYFYKGFTEYFIQNRNFKGEVGCDC